MVEIRPISGLCAWRGENMVSSDSWIRDLRPADIAEIEAALVVVEDRGLSWDEIMPADFPLPGMSALFDDVRDELEHGCGMLKLRGVPVGNYNEDQLRKIYFGLGQNIGSPVHQNRRGEVMRFIRDEGTDVGEKYGQIATATMDDGKPFLSSYARTLTNGALRFHTDRTDVVSLLCVNQAASGGVSTICSSVSVMNTMLDRRPDLTELLYEPYFRSRLGEEARVPEDVYPLPVFAQRDGKFTSHFSLTYIEAAQKTEVVPKLSGAQAEAIDVMLEVAAELSFEMILEPGDIQFLNSHVTYHGRTPFEDDQEAGLSRLLMRLWLSMPNSRPLPIDHAVLWRDTEPGQIRGGICQIPELQHGVD